MIYDAVILGAGASGLFCAVTAAARGAKICVLEALPEPGKKMSICGGGFGNFSNTEVHPLKHYYSHNPHFPFSALKRFTTDKILKQLELYGLEWETRGNCYFCTEKFALFADALYQDAAANGAVFRFNTRVTDILKKEDHFELTTQEGVIFSARQVVFATGSTAYPQLGANGSGQKMAVKLGHTMTPVKPGLAPIRFPADCLAITGELSGIALENIGIKTVKESFTGSLVFRPDGISGLAVFKAASSWAWYGGEMEINWLPDENILDWIQSGRTEHGTQTVKNRIAQKLPRRLALAIVSQTSWAEKTLSQLKKTELDDIVNTIHHWTFTPAGTGGIHEGEVILGGIATEQISSKTFESETVSGLFFTGEMLDVTGQLGGYNLHWAFASGHAAGESLRIYS